MNVIWADEDIESIGVGIRETHMEVPVGGSGARAAAIVFQAGEDCGDIPSKPGARFLASFEGTFVEVAAIRRGEGAREWDLRLTADGSYDVYDVNGVACILPTGPWDDVAQA